VSDTGIGMDADTRHRIFEPFFTTKAVGHGTGLGLSTVSSIVEQCGGRVTVTSGASEGTTFTVYLPQTDEPAEVATMFEPASEESRATETVLLVEDEEAVRRLAVRTLREHGYQVLEARNGSEALEIWGKRGAAIDVLLTDIVMPGMTGVELAEKIAARGQPPAVVLMSAYASPDTVGRAAQSSGAPQFVEKPFKQAALLRAVRQALRTRT
jgi:two-component system, cell cycle sensor histidine kinase and response regulator CckA